MYFDGGIWPLYKAIQRRPCFTEKKRKRVSPTVEIGKEDCESRGDFCNGALPPGTIFKFQIEAFTENWHLGGSSTGFFTIPTRPATPDINKKKFIPSASGTELQILFEPPRANISLRIRVVQDPDKEPRIYNVSNNYTVPNLEPRTTYTVSLTAVLRYTIAHEIHEVLSEESPGKRIHTGWKTLDIILGVVISLLVLAIIVILVMLLSCKRIGQEKHATSDVANHSNNRAAHELLDQTKLLEISIPIQFTEFESKFRDFSRDSNFEFSRQFENLRDVGKTESKSDATSQENRMKNR